MSEEWRDVVGYEGRYEVSNLGRIRTVARSVPYQRWNAAGIRRIEAKVRKPSINKANGYAYVPMADATGKLRNRRVHVMVLEAFVGPRPPGMHGCHGSRGQSCNELSNLRWDTPAANNADKARDGTTQEGSKNGCAKLTEAQVATIKSKLSRSTLKALATEYNVSIPTIHQIKTGKKWTHVV